MKRVMLAVGLAALAGCKTTENADTQTTNTMILSDPDRIVLATALNEALEDERKAEAYYEAVITEYGERMPFVGIANAERNHQRALLAQFTRFGIEAPANHEWSFDVPETFEAACEQAAQAERENAALYDDLVMGVHDETVLAVFDRLQSVTLNRHLPAFERAAAGLPVGRGVGQGAGRGQGAGQGVGQGLGCCGACLSG